MITVVVLVLGFFFFEAMGYATHRLFHFRWMGKLYEVHMKHHLVEYPWTNFLSNVYRKVAGPSTFAIFIPFALAMVAVLFWAVPLYLAILLTIELGCVALLNDRMHHALHIRGHWMERIPWFIKLRRLHWHHHQDLAKNLGIYTFTTDRLVGTYEDPDLAE